MEQERSKHRLLTQPTTSLAYTSPPVKKKDLRLRAKIPDPSVLADPLIGKLADFLHDTAIPPATKEGLSNLINSSIDLIHTTMESIAIAQLAPQEDEEDE